MMKSRFGSGIAEWFLLAAAAGVAAASCGLNSTGAEAERSAGGASAESNGSQSSSNGNRSSWSSGSGSGGGCPAGFQCVPPVAAGEYALITEGGAECPSSWGPAQQAAADIVDPGCAECTCTHNNDGSCASGGVQQWQDGSCVFTEKSYSDLADGQCVDVVKDFTGPRSFRVAMSQVDQGTCKVATGGKKPLDVRTICRAEANFSEPCAGGGVCVPVAPSSFELCNTLPSDGQCADGWTASKPLHPVVGDSRSCECACSATGATCSGGQISLHKDVGCAAPSLQVIPEGPTCVDITGGGVNNNLEAFKVKLATWAAGSCDPVVNMSGNVTFGGAMTVCCVAKND